MSSADQGAPAQPSLAQVTAVLDRLYPPGSAQDWDAVGLVCGDPDQPVRKVLLAVDPTSDVVDEALEWGADLLLVHHPLLLRGVHGVRASTPKGRLVHRLIRGGGAPFVAHTNADSAAPRGGGAPPRGAGRAHPRPPVPRRPRRP